MTSQIDPTKPTSVNAYTADVRSNFTAASNEITELQNRTSEWALISTNVEPKILYGINTHIGQPEAAYNNETGVIDEVVSLGFNAIRDNCSWATFEASAGVYTFNPTGDANSQDMFNAWAHNLSNGYNLHTIFGCLYNNSALYGSTPNATWRAHFIDAYESVATEYLAAGYDPAKLTMEIWNEPNTTAFGQLFNDVTEADEYANLMMEFYTAIKAIDSGITVAAPATSDGWRSIYLTWNQAVWAVAGWSQGADVWSDHPYHIGFTVGERNPERIFWYQNRFVRESLYPAALLEGKSNLLTSISEIGFDTTTFTDAVATKYLVRSTALCSCLPKLTEFTIYELIETAGQTFGISTSLGVRKTQATDLAEFLVHIKPATERRYYRTADYTSGHHAVLIDTAHVSQQKLLIWTLDGNTNVTLRVFLSAAGNFNYKPMGGSIVTVSLAAGVHDRVVPITDTLTAVWSAIPITFQNFAK